MARTTATRAGFFGITGLAAGLAIGAGAMAVASDRPAQPEKDGDMGGQAMDGEAMMRAMQAANPMTAHHEGFKSMAGVWDGLLTAEMEGMGAFESKGTMTMTPIMDGRFLEQNWDGDMMGVPYQGRSLLGYSTVEGKFQSVWIDSTANTLHYYEGHAKGDNTFVMMGKETDPMSGMTMETKDVITHHDENSMTFERHYITPGGDVPGFKIEYTRRK